MTLGSQIADWNSDILRGYAPECGSIPCREERKCIASP